MKNKSKLFDAKSYIDPHLFCKNLLNKYFKDKKIINLVEIVRACRYVDEVIDSMPEDADVWAIHHYNKLFVGSDYKDTPRFKRYEEYFSDKDVEIVYFPYTKTTSSTKLRKIINDKINI